MKSVGVKRRSSHRAGASRLRRGSPRVAAWIHLALNPLLEDLSVQGHMLRRGDLTFRHDSKQLGFLRPLAEHVIGPSRLAYDDLVRSHPVWRSRIEKRDRARDALEAEARRYFETLVRNPAFRKEARHALVDYRKHHPRAEYPGGPAPDSLFPEVVAERLVNDDREVPEHYAVARFWNGYQRRFDRYRRSALAPEIGRRMRRLLAEVEALQRDLGEFRFELCEKYELPPVPYGTERGI